MTKLNLLHFASPFTAALLIPVQPSTRPERGDPDPKDPAVSVKPSLAVEGDADGPRTGEETFASLLADDPVPTDSDAAGRASSFQDMVQQRYREQQGLSPDVGAGASESEADPMSKPTHLVGTSV